MNAGFVSATSADGRKVRINLANVTFLTSFDGFTRVNFISGRDAYIDVNEPVEKLLPG